MLERFRTRDLVREHGRWDPQLDAYEAMDPKTGEMRYFVWRKEGLFLDAIVVAGSVLFWIVVGSFFYLLFFHYPNGVAGDRQAQLAYVLREKYNISARWLPEQWTPTQVFEIDVEQAWDEPGYSERPPTGKGCKLQPGATSRDLSLECPGAFGVMDEPRVGGADADQDRTWRQRMEEDLNITDPDATYEQYLEEFESEMDPYDEGPYYPDPEPYFPEPEEMYP
ncbi:MAG: hypothetical protein U0R27_07735 [Candidatus Nanopelagicales bacterium]